MRICKSASNNLNRAALLSSGVDFLSVTYPKNLGNESSSVSEYSLAQAQRHLTEYAD